MACSSAQHRSISSLPYVETSMMRREETGTRREGAGLAWLLWHWALWHWAQATMMMQRRSVTHASPARSEDTFRAALSHCRCCQHWTDMAMAEVLAHTSYRPPRRRTSVWPAKAQSPRQPTNQVTELGTCLMDVRSGTRIRRAVNAFTVTASDVHKHDIGTLSNSTTNLAVKLSKHVLPIALLLY